MPDGRSENPQGSNRALWLAERALFRAAARLNGIERPIQQGKSAFRRDRQLPNLDENLQIAGTMRTQYRGRTGLSFSPSCPLNPHDPFPEPFGPFGRRVDVIS